MKKKLVSILLAVATVAGTCGAPAVAVFAEEGTETVAETEAVEDAEDAIYKNDVPDITDLINKIIEGKSEK